MRTAPFSFPARTALIVADLRFDVQCSPSFSSVTRLQQRRTSRHPTNIISPLAIIVAAERRSVASNGVSSRSLRILTLQFLGSAVQNVQSNGKVAGGTADLLLQWSMALFVSRVDVFNKSTIVERI
jgi:hypothetical protein